MTIVTSHAPGTPSWVDVAVPDVDAGVAFYTGLFGWTAEDQGADAFHYHMLKQGDHSVAGLGPLQGEGAPPAWTTYVTVADADAASRAIVAAGGAVLAEPFDVMTAGRMGVFTDPTGAAIAVWQPGESIGAEVVNEPVSLAWNELNTRDRDAVAPFYATVFGWTAKAAEDSPFPYTEFQLDGRSIGGMMPMGDDWDAAIPNHWVAYFAVEDCDATVARAQELGGSLLYGPLDLPTQGRMAVLADPAGASFDVIAG